MSRTRYTDRQQILERIDFFKAKHAENIRLAEVHELAAQQLKTNAEELSGTPRVGLLTKADIFLTYRDEYLSMAKHEEEVTLKKLQEKLAEFDTAPMAIVPDNSIKRS